MQLSSTRTAAAGSRPTYSATPNAILPADTAADIYGGSKLYDYVGNIDLKYTPTKDWLADLGFRDEYERHLQQRRLHHDQPGDRRDDASPHQHHHGQRRSPIRTTTTTSPPRSFPSSTSASTASPSTPITTTRIDHGNQHWINPYAAITTTGAGVVTTASAPIGSVFFQEANQDDLNAKVGANWNASKFLTIRAEVFRKDHQNRFVGADDIIGTKSYGALYVTGYTFTGVKLSVILKPHAGADLQHPLPAPGRA